ncbi:MAG: oligosaccharide flippase family protein [Rikenellaceae bacterium]
MLEKLAKQSAIYGISTILGRMLGYLLTPYYTRIFEPSAYGVITDLYALIPFALIVLSMGLESSYFRFATKAEIAHEGNISSVKKAKDELFATAWGITSLAALVLCALSFIFADQAAALMGEVYVKNRLYIPIVATIILFDIAATIPFARLREQGKAIGYVSFKMINIILQVVLAIAFGLMGLFSTDFGVGWALVANLIASTLTFMLILTTTSGIIPRIKLKIFVPIIGYSLPLLVSGVAATATEFIDRQMIKHIIPVDSMAQLGIYGAVVKIAVVMTLFTQMYRLAAEPFFLANYKKSDFVAMNAAAMKYFVMASMLIFLGISLFRNLFALIVGAEYREGIYILPVVLGANVLMGIWLNLSFWYKREEKTHMAIIITLAGLVASVALNLILVPRWGYYGAAWARFLGEGVMVAVSYYLCRRYFPTPYEKGAILSYITLGIALFYTSEFFAPHIDNTLARMAINILLIAIYVYYAVRREKIDIKALAISATAKILRR